MINVIVTREVLDLYDEYDGDFGLLDERWAPEEDRKRLTSQQMHLFSQYVDKLRFLQVENLSAGLRASTEAKVTELETFIDRDVAQIVRKRVQSDGAR